MSGTRHGRWFRRSPQRARPEHAAIPDAVQEEAGPGEPPGTPGAETPVPSDGDTENRSDGVDEVDAADGVDAADTQLDHVLRNAESARAERPHGED